MTLPVTRKIFTQSNREINENNLYRVATTLIREGKLYAIRDITLAPKQELDILCEEGHQLIIVPVTGSLNLLTSQYIGDLNPGESFVINTGSFCVLNPFEEQLINFLIIDTIGISAAKSVDNVQLISADLHCFDINRWVNMLIPVSDASVNGLSISVGKFRGRQDHTIHHFLSIFLYVLEGAFEAAECLLEDRDSLAVQGLAECDFEALSDNAIILAITGV